MGAGITGLSVALELLLRGRKVTVCESNTIGAGSTGGSTGHLDAHPEIGPRKLIERMGVDLAAEFTRLRLNAIEHIGQRSDGSCDFKRIPGYYYTEVKGDLDAVRSECEDALRIGIDVRWVDSVPIAKAVGGYKIEGMASIDSMAYLPRPLPTWFTNTEERFLNRQ